MGYYSNYDGSYSPVRKLTDNESNTILKWFKDRFGEYSVNGNEESGNWYSDCGRIFYPTVDGEPKYYLGSIFYEPSSQKVWPVACNMKGYYFNYHLYEFTTFLNSIGVKFKGNVERDGEESDDLERISIEKGKVISRRGKFVYVDPVEIKTTEKEYTKALNERVQKIINEEK